MHKTRAAIEGLGREGFVVPTDITKPGDVKNLTERTLEHFGRVDVLVNNSGIGGPSAPLWEIDLPDWEETFAVNVTGTYLCCQAFLPSMIERKSGSVIIISSMSGKRPLWGRTPYAASKMALIGLARTLAVEVGPLGIRVNLISPGAVEGERIEWVISKQAKGRGISTDQARRELVSGAPLERLVPPGDVASAAVFLASDAASFVTGTLLMADGGWTATDGRFTPPGM